MGRVARKRSGGVGLRPTYSRSFQVRGQRGAAGRNRDRAKEPRGGIFCKGRSAGSSALDCVFLSKRGFREAAGAEGEPSAMMCQVLLQKLSLLNL